MEQLDSAFWFAIAMVHGAQEATSAVSAPGASSDGGMSTVTTAIIAAIAAITAAVISVSGTLAGAAVTGRNNRQLEKDRAERDNRTRFNFKRVEVYGNFLSLVNGLIAMDSIPEEQLEAFRLRYFETRVIATDPVKAAAKHVFELVLEHWGEEDHSKRTDLANTIGGGATKRFLDEAEKELGLSSAEPG